MERLGAHEGLIRLAKDLNVAAKFAAPEGYRLVAEISVTASVKSSEEQFALPAFHGN